MTRYGNDIELGPFVIRNRGPNKKSSKNVRSEDLSIPVSTIYIISSVDKGKEDHSYI